MVETNYNSSYRIIWVDVAKGFAILLVVIGHTVMIGIHGILIRGSIFSFHMPLFFMLSGFTLHCSNNLEVFLIKVIALVRKLIVPIIVVWVVLLFYDLSLDYSLAGQLEFWKKSFYSLIVGSGVAEQILGFEVPALGKPWFLYALFFARIIFEYVHLNVKDSQRILWYMGLSLLGIITGQIIHMPFSLDLALTVQLFMYFGYIWPKGKVIHNNAYNMIMAFFIWLPTFLLQFPSYENQTYLELAVRRYPLFPLCFITAVAGSIMVIEFSVLVSSFYWLRLPFAFIGRYSMVFFLVHCLDNMWKDFWLVEGHQMISTVYRIGLDSSVFLIFVLCRKLMTIYMGKKSF